MEWPEWLTELSYLARYLTHRGTTYEQVLSCTTKYVGTPGTQGTNRVRTVCHTGAVFIYTIITPPFENRRLTIDDSRLTIDDLRPVGCTLYDML